MTHLSHNLILRSVLYTFVLALVGLNLLNPDLLIAEHNIARVGDTKNIDIVYLTTDLSEDAMPALAPFLLSGQSSSVANPNEVKAALSIIKSRDIRYSPDWQSWNWSRVKAHAFVKDLNIPVTGTGTENLLWSN